MTQALTTGEKNRRANIRRMKAIGAKNAKAHQAQAVANYLDHVARNNAAAEQAAHARALRISKHERQNRMLAENAADARRAKKAVEAREAAGIPSIGTLIDQFGTEGAADILLSGTHLPLAA